MIETHKTIEVWTDGACEPNPGVGGWSWVTLDGRSSSGRDSQSTNNRMEMRAVLEAIRELHEPGVLIKIYSDSQYVIHGCTRWMPKWKKNGWKRSPKSNKEIKNTDLWLELDDALSHSLIEFVWVRGHSGNVMNEVADQMANSEATRG